MYQTQNMVLCYFLCPIPSGRSWSYLNRNTILIENSVVTSLFILCHHEVTFKVSHCAGKEVTIWSRNIRNNTHSLSTTACVLTSREGLSVQRLHFYLHLSCTTVNWFLELVLPCFDIIDVSCLQNESASSEMQLFCEECCKCLCRLVAHFLMAMNVLVL